MDALKGLSDASKAMLSLIILVVVILIIYGVIKITHIMGLGETADNLGKTAANVSGVASSLSGYANDVFSPTGTVQGTQGAFQKLIADAAANPLDTNSFKGPYSDSTSEAAIKNYADEINDDVNHSVFNIVKDITDLWGASEPGFINIIASIPSQTDVWRVVARYNNDYNDDIFAGVNAHLNATRQDELAQAILQKPLTV